MPSKLITSIRGHWVHSIIKRECFSKFRYFCRAILILAFMMLLRPSCQSIRDATDLATQHFVVIFLPFQQKSTPETWFLIRQIIPRILQYEYSCSLQLLEQLRLLCALLFLKNLSREGPVSRSMWNNWFHYVEWHNREIVCMCKATVTKPRGKKSRFQTIFFSVNENRIDVRALAK